MLLFQLAICNSSFLNCLSTFLVQSAIRLLFMGESAISIMISSLPFVVIFFLFSYLFSTLIFFFYEVIKILCI